MILRKILFLIVNLILLFIGVFVGWIIYLALDFTIFFPIARSSWVVVMLYYLIILAIFVISIKFLKRKNNQMLKPYFISIYFGLIIGGTFFFLYPPTE